MAKQPDPQGTRDDLPTIAAAPATGARLGGYRVVRELGRGGMGVVYLAHDPRLDRDVAIKTLSKELSGKEARSRCEREARTIARLNHPSVATVFDFGEHEGSTVLVMEYVEGDTLREVLRRGRLSLPEAVSIATQVAEGLAAAHEQNVVHRDLKPSNVMRGRDGRVKILDFGLAKSFRGDPSGEHGVEITAEHRVVGTSGYLSPEQLRGRPVDARSDVFAFGVLLYELITGEPPFRGESQADDASATLSTDPSPARALDREVPRALEQILARCLAKKPESRYASATPLLDDLRRVETRGVGDEPAEGPSVAVLPFANLSADPENEYFADGMAEEIINALCKIEALRVAARTSSFAFKGRNEDIRKIGRELGVTTVLEGSVRRSANRLRITAQLVKVSDGYHLWSDRFDREMHDVFAVQDEIAESIASALRLVLGEREREAIRKMRTRSAEAHDFFLRGLASFHEVSQPAFERAEAMFRRAVEIDPTYALAWAELAESLAWRYDWYERDDALLGRIDEASRRALELEPELAEAHVARGQFYFRTDSPSDARREFDEAIRLDPRSFDAYWFCGRCCMQEGKLREAVEYFRRSNDIRPESFQSIGLAVTCLRGLGRLEEARALARRGVAAIEKHLNRNPDDVRAIYFLANNWASLGEREKAVEWAARALRMRDDDGTRYNIACVYTQLGMVDEALGLLERNAEHTWGNREWIENDPDLEHLRGHPRFQAVLERLT